MKTSWSDLEPEDRRLILRFMLDANRINARQADPQMNQLEEWRRNGLIDLLMARAANDEARAGDSAERDAKAAEYIYVSALANTSGERDQIRRIGAVLFPSGVQTQSEQNDVEIVFCSLKYGAPLVTADGASKKQPRGILGSRDQLLDLGVRVLKTEEAVTLVKDEVTSRDDRGCNGGTGAVRPASDASV